MNVSKVNNSDVCFNGRKITNKENGTNNKTQKNKKKTIIACAMVSSTIALALFTGKKYLLNKNNCTTLNKSIENTASFVEDKLSYKIQPPSYDPSIIIEKGSSNFPLYNSIVENMKKDNNTNTRLNEVLKTMSEDLNAVNNKISEITHSELTVSAPNQIIISDIDVAKKRYYSMAAHKQQGYSCVDPLLFQKSREEIVDLYTGYNLLEELNTNSESKLLNDAINSYSSKIKEEDIGFIQSCVKKLLPEDAKCYGQESVLHCSDLFKVGKIFREAMNLSVR